MGQKKKKKKRRASELPRRPESGLLGTVPAATLDLHGETAAVAQGKVIGFVTAQARINGGQVVHVVTGSGLGSPGGPVLRGRVGDLLDGRLARFVEEHRMDLHRGGWLVRLK